MVTFICLFFPAVLSVWIYERTAQKSFSKKEWFYCWVLNTFLINFACFLVKQFVLHTAGVPLYTLNEDMLPTTAWRYMVMSGAVAVVLPFVEHFCTDKFKITIETKEDKK